MNSTARRLVGRCIIVLTVPVWFPILGLFCGVTLFGSIPVYLMSWFLFGDSERLGDKYERVVFGVMNGFDFLSAKLQGTK